MPNLYSTYFDFVTLLMIIAKGTYGITLLDVSIIHRLAMSSLSHYKKSRPTRAAVIVALYIIAWCEVYAWPVTDIFICPIAIA